MKKIYLSLFNRYSNFALLFLLIIICLFAYSSKDFKLDASSDTLILEQDEDLKKYRKIIKDYGSSDFLIVTFTDKNRILTDINLEQIKLFTDEIVKLRWVDSIQSIFDVPLLEVNNQSLTDLINEILTIESLEVNLKDAENELLNSPIFKNLIISEDATSTGVLVNFKKNTRYEFLINERDRLRDLANPSRNDLDTLNQIINEYEIIKKDFDKERHENINEIRKIIEKFSSKMI